MQIPAIHQSEDPLAYHGYVPYIEVVDPSRFNTDLADSAAKSLMNRIQGLAAEKITNDLRPLGICLYEQGLLKLELFNRLEALLNEADNEGRCPFFYSFVVQWQEFKGFNPRESKSIIEVFMNQYAALENGQQCRNFIDSLSILIHNERNLVEEEVENYYPVVCRFADERFMGRVQSVKSSIVNVFQRAVRCFRCDRSARAQQSTQQRTGLPPARDLNPSPAIEPRSEDSSPTTPINSPACDLIGYDYPVKFTAPLFFRKIMHFTKNAEMNLETSLKFVIRTGVIATLATAIISATVMVIASSLTAALISSLIIGGVTFIPFWMFTLYLQRTSRSAE